MCVRKIELIIKYELIFKLRYNYFNIIILDASIDWRTCALAKYGIFNY